MKQNKIIWLLVGVLFVFSISGCQTTPSPVAATQQVLPTTGSYPASVVPANPTAGSYPAPATIAVTTQVAPQSAYPSPVSGPATVAWADAEQTILKGDVTTIVITKSLSVTLTLKNGQTEVTTAPAADAVQKAITTCGDLCKNVSVTNP
jgi:hypothetical protein